MTENKKIRNATRITYNDIKFKSLLEKNIYVLLEKQGFNPQYEKFTYVIFDEFKPIVPFYEEETTKHKLSRLKKDNKVKTKILLLKDTKVKGITYTPDITFEYNGIFVIIELKGKENDVYPYKKKLFRKCLDDMYIKDNKPVLFFEIHSKTQALQAINIIKEYEKTK